MYCNYNFTSAQGDLDGETRISIKSNSDNPHMSVPIIVLLELLRAAGYILPDQVADEDLAKEINSTIKKFN